MKTLLKFIPLVALCAFQCLCAEELPEPQTVVMAKGETLETKADEIRAARRYAAFWNTGDPRYAEEALSPDFIDLRMPHGREPGIKGALEASKMFRGAVPDLSVKIEKMIVAADQVILILLFEGHFTGEFKKVKGKGQKVSFNSVDIYKIKNGKISENWHLEDDAKFLEQIGILK